MLEIVWRNPDKSTTSRPIHKDGSDITRSGLTLLKFIRVASLNSLAVAQGKDVPPYAGTLDHSQAIDKTEKTK